MNQRGIIHIATIVILTAVIFTTILYFKNQSSSSPNLPVSELPTTTPTIVTKQATLLPTSSQTQLPTITPTSWVTTTIIIDTVYSKHPLALEYPSTATIYEIEQLGMRGYGIKGNDFELSLTPHTEVWETELSADITPILNYSLGQLYRVQRKGLTSEYVYTNTAPKSVPCTVGEEQLPAPCGAWYLSNDIVGLLVATCTVEPVAVESCDKIMATLRPA